MQIPHLPLLQLVGLFSRHERFYQIITPCFRSQQPTNRVCSLPTATEAPRYHRKIHERRTAINMREEPTKRGRQAKGGIVKEQQWREEQEDKQAGHLYQREREGYLGSFPRGQGQDMRWEDMTEIGEIIEQREN